MTGLQMIGGAGLFLMAWGSLWIYTSSFRLATAAMAILGLAFFFLSLVLGWTP